MEPQLKKLISDIKHQTRAAYELINGWINPTVKCNKLTFKNRTIKIVYDDVDSYNACVGFAKTASIVINANDIADIFVNYQDQMTDEDRFGYLILNVAHELSHLQQKGVYRHHGKNIYDIEWSNELNARAFVVKNKPALEQMLRKPFDISMAVQLCAYNDIHMKAKDSTYHAVRDIREKLYDVMHLFYLDLEKFEKTQPSDYMIYFRVLNPFRDKNSIKVFQLHPDRGMEVKVFLKFLDEDIMDFYKWNVGISKEGNQLYYDFIPEGACKEGCIITIRPIFDEDVVPFLGDALLLKED